MSRITWDQIGERFYETGAKNAVLYVMGSNGTYQKGVPWNGLTAVTESPSGAESTALYADDIKYLNLVSNEEFGATVEAYFYPDEFAVCNGEARPEDVPGLSIGQQGRRAFGMCYRTTVGNDTEGTEYGYKLHIIYNALAAPSEKAYTSINESPEAITFSWELTTTPVAVTGHKPVASLTIESKKATPAALKALEDKLYGTDGEGSGTEPTLPTPDEVIALLKTGA